MSEEANEEAPADAASTGTYLVTQADDESAVLRDVETGQIHTLSGNPAIDEGDSVGASEEQDARDLLEAGEVLEATLAPEPPLEVAWSVVEVTDRREIPVERSPERPTKLARDLAAEQAVGEVTRRERAGEGEVHVLTVPDEETDAAAADVLEDEATVERAAALGVARVEIRAAEGVLSVRYLPD